MNWQPGSACGMSPSYISNRIVIRTPKAGSISYSGERKNLVAVLKINPKIQQIVLVLFVLGVPAAQQREALRLEKTGEAMGSAFTVEVYGENRVEMEAAVDAAIEEVHR